MSKATFPGTCKNYVSQLASTPTEHGKTIIFFGSYSMLEIEIIKLNHSFKVCVPVDDWKMKLSKLF